MVIVSGALIGSAVTLGCLLIPLVHFFSGPLGPFIGGFIAGSKMRPTILQTFGIAILMGIFLAIPTYGISGFWVHGELRVYLALGLLFYTAMLATAGTLFGCSAALKAR